MRMNSYTLLNKNLGQKNLSLVFDQKINKYRGAHQMRPFCRHSFIIFIIIVVVVIVVGHSKSFQPRKPRFSSFKNIAGQMDGWMDGRTDGRMDGRDLL